MGLPLLRRDDDLVGVYGDPKRKAELPEAVLPEATLNVRVDGKWKAYVEKIAYEHEQSQRAVVERFIGQARVLREQLEPLAEELEAFGAEHGFKPPLDAHFPEVIALAVKQLLAHRGSATPKKPKPK